jgi:Tfp pilus assembly protein PilF
MNTSNAVETKRTCGFTEPSARSLHWLMIAVVAAVTLSVFSLVRHAEFVPWDDDINIYGNPHIRGITAESLKWMFTDTSYVHRYMPIGWLAFAIDYQLAHGCNPATYHIGNLLLHTFNAVLVFLLIGHLLQKAKPAMPSCAVPIAAAVGALFWSIHPLRAEPVAWSSARIYHVAMFFLLTSTLAYVKFAGDGKRKVFYSLAAVLFLLGALTYPIVIGFPVVLVVLDFYPFRRMALTKGKIFSPEARRVWLEKIPFFAISAFVVGATLWNRTHATRFVPAASLDEFGVLSRAAQGFYVWGAYLWKTCWPLGLCPTYTELLEFHWWGPRFVCSFLLVCGLTALFIRQSRRWPAALALWVAYLALLFPMLGLTEHPHYIYDRYSFMVGVLCSLAVAWFVLHAWQNPRWRAAVIGSASVALALLGGLSFKQAGIWNSANTLLPYMISQLGDHPVRAKQDLVYGVILMREGRVREAEESFRNAIRFNANSPDAHAYLGDVLTDQKRFPEAIAVYRRALELKPSHLHARLGLGGALGAMKQFDAAVAAFEQVLLVDAKNVNALHNLAVTLTLMGRKELAMNYFRQEQSIRGTSDRASR